MMNSLEKAVAGRTLEEASWNNTRLLKDDAVEAVRGLKAEDGKDIHVFGSADLLAPLLAAGLVDEYRVCLVPIVVEGAIHCSSRKSRRSGCVSKAPAHSRPAK